MTPTYILRADEVPGLDLVGLTILDNEGRTALVYRRVADSAAGPYLLAVCGSYPFPLTNPRIDPRDPTTRYRLVDWMRAGERCPDCANFLPAGVCPSDTSAHPRSWMLSRCATCEDTGYCRLPCDDTPGHWPDVRWMRDPDPRVSPEGWALVVAESCRRVAREDGPILGVRDGDCNYIAGGIAPDTMWDAGTDWIAAGYALLEPDGSVQVLR